MSIGQVVILAKSAALAVSVTRPVLSGSTCIIALSVLIKFAGDMEPAYIAKCTGESMAASPMFLKPRVTVNEVLVDTKLLRVESALASGASHIGKPLVSSVVCCCKKLLYGRTSSAVPNIPSLPGKTVAGLSWCVGIVRSSFTFTELYWNWFQTGRAGAHNPGGLLENTHISA